MMRISAPFDKKSGKKTEKIRRNEKKHYLCSLNMGEKSH